MPPARVPADEIERLAWLRETRVLDTAPEAAFDDVVRVASELCGVPMAVVTLVDADRQWFKARVGLVDAQTPREISFCAHALECDAPLVVRDTLVDARFSDNPQVTGDPRIRFYAGVPLRIGPGSAIGTLCVVDHVPRTLTAGQMEALCALARQVSIELRLRRDLGRARAERNSTSGLPAAMGEVVAGYEIDALLGRGGTGVVMTGVDRAGKRAAIKFLLPEVLGQPWALERFAREARVLSRLRSPHAARIYDVGDLDNGAPYIVMEYLEGTDLERLLAERGRCSPSDVVGWVLQACHAVSEAHALGVVHRDLKPSNLFLARTPQGETIKVLDFGIAKERVASGATLTAHEAVLGSTHYMAPEQLLSSRDADIRADVWSLGVVLYELMAGRAPFEGDTVMQVCAAVLAHPTPSLRSPELDIPEPLERAVMGCLVKDRGRRTQSVRQLVDELSAAVAGVRAPTS